MNKDHRQHRSFDAFDEHLNPRPAACDFDHVVAAAMSRRDFLGRVLVFGSVAAIGGGLTALTATDTKAAADRFAFDAVAASTADTLTVPAGYSAEVLIRWGDPLWSDAPPFDPVSRGTAASQARAFGDNTDGMDIFQHRGHSVLVANNEYANPGTLWGNDSGKPLTADDIAKSMMAHGVSVVELAYDDGAWRIVQDSPYNRRITPQTDMVLTGPAAGHRLLKTAADPTGTTAKGTWNNCGNGTTPWGTYLTCEENFNGYFSAADQAYRVSAALKRYGVSTRGWGYQWAKIDDRFDVSKHPNEPNRAGYIVEIDPADSDSTPRKLTALGRFKHENAEVVVNGDGRVVVYMGDDERGEFIYRFVSDGVFTPGADTDGLLEQGMLSVAKFNDDGTGAWLALTPETTGLASPGDICIHTRQAGSAVGATTMDRPEWIAVNPHKAEVYCALTNNKYRGLKPNQGGDHTPVGGPNPREANRYGQIVRWRPVGGDHTATGFHWDLYVLAGNPAVHHDANAGSANVTVGNMFNSPDGITFDATGLLWIQTDGKYSNTGDFAGQGNNQMLAGDPVTGDIRRFLVGPTACEVTGMCWSPDRRTLFVGIQHPGKDGNGHWPEGGNAVPRSAIVAITRADGGLVG